MSLAAALSAGGGRPASFLPAIKCSNCGDEIEIALMGDHVCGKAPSSASTRTDTSNPFTLRQLNATGKNPATMPVPLQYPNQQPPPQTRLRAPTIGSQNPSVPKLLRTAPPRINPDAANRPFLAPQPLRSQAPISPALSNRSGSSNGSKPTPLRSMTSPMPRMFDMRPPSPELTGGFDSPFPVFPTPRSSSGSRPGTSNGRKTPSGERSASRGELRPERPTLGDPVNLDTPKSPMQSSHMMQRMNTLKSGPFEAGRRKQSRDEKLPPMPMSARRPSAPSIGPAPVEPLPLPPVTAVSASPPDAQRKEPPQRPARPQEDVLSPTFLGAFSKEPEEAPASAFSSTQEPTPLSQTDRSKTFPLRQESSDTPGPARGLARMPSEPALRPGRQRRPTLTAGPNTAPSQVPQVDPPPQSLSRNGTRMDYRLQDAPPVPKPVQERRAEFSHAPSESSSSAGSTHRSYTEGSSGPSPITSAASSVDAFSPLRDDLAPYGDDEKMRVAGLSVKSQQKPGMRAEQPTQRSPPRTHRAQRSVEAQVVPETPTTMPSLAPLLESPMDPEMHRNTPSPFFRKPEVAQPPPESAWPALTRTATSPMPAPTPTASSPQKSLDKPFNADDYDPYRAPSPQPPVQPQSINRLPSPQPPTLDRITSRSPRPFSPQNSSAFPPPPPSSTSSRPQPTRRPTAGVKAICRGCNLTIEGKSVKAADGRLTGRWHKQCFTCRTCAQPFATADFYVIDNQPYCEHHYHEANGSLCAGCKRGIEGQYLETTSSGGRSDRKFHPRCFTCADCRVVLSDDYFEINGKVFCERDALRNMRGQARLAGPGVPPAGPPGSMGRGGQGQGFGLGLPGRDGLKAERRTTRLMMM